MIQQQLHQGKKGQFGQNRGGNNVWIINSSQRNNEKKTRNDFEKGLVVGFQRNIYMKSLENIINNPTLSTNDSLREKIMLEKVKGKVIEAENRKINELLEMELEKKRLAKEAEEILMNFNHQAMDESLDV